MGISTTDPRIYDLFNISPGGVHVNAESATRIAAVFRCIEILSSTAAGLPWALMEKRDGGRFPASGHPNARLYSRPSPLLTDFVFRKAMFVGALSAGEAFAWQIRNGNGRTVALHVYTKGETTVKAYNGDLWYTFTCAKGLRPSTTVAVPSSEVIHFKPFPAADGISGVSVITKATESIRLSIRAQKFANEFLDNGARPSGVFTSDTTTTKDQRGQLMDSLSEAGRVGGTPFLPGGVRFERLSIPPSDFQLLELSKASVPEICTWFGVPVELVSGMGEVSGKNIEQQSLKFLTYTLEPHIENFRKEFDYKTLLDREQGRFYTHFNFNSLLRTDAESRANYFKAMALLGVYSPNDMRDLEDMNPIEGGDIHYVQGANVPLDQLRDFYAAKAAPTKDNRPPEPEEMPQA